MKCPKCENLSDFAIDLIETNLIRANLFIEDYANEEWDASDDRTIEILEVYAAPEGYSKCNLCSFEAPTKQFDDGEMPYPIKEIAASGS